MHLIIITIINYQLFWGRYCVIVYVGLFLTPLFGSLSVRSLLYTPISLLFTPNYFSTVYHHVLLRV